MMLTLNHYNYQITKITICHYAKCRDLFILKLSAIMLSVVKLSVVILSVIILSVVMLSVVMLSVFMLSVMAPWDICIRNQGRYSQHFVFFVTNKLAH